MYRSTEFPDVLNNFTKIDILLKSFQKQYKTLSLPTLTFENAISVLPPETAEIIKAVYALTPYVAGLQDLTEQPESLFITPNKSIYAQRFIRVTPLLLESFIALQKQLKKATDQHIKIISGYRSPAYQAILLLGGYARNGYDMPVTLRTYMPPGYSQHGRLNGLAIDVGHHYNTEEVFGESSSFKWMQAHASEYGFRLTYPKQQDRMRFEPWHWQFVGKT